MTESPVGAPHPFLLALPNLLTLARLPLAAAVWFAPGSRVWVVSVLAAAAITDMLDGWVARTIRKRRWVKHRHPGSFAAGTGLGAFLDPLCDKIFTASVLVAVAVGFSPPLHLVFAVGTRELLMAPAMLVFATVDGPWRDGHDFTAGWPGKLTTVLQFSAIAVLMFYDQVFEAVALACIPAGVLTVAFYTRRAMKAG